MKNKKKKPWYKKVRLPMIRQTGGAHQSQKGGKYHRNLEKGKAQQEIQDELAG